MVKCVDCGFAYGLGDRQGGVLEPLEVTRAHRDREDLFGARGFREPGFYCFLNRPEIEDGKSAQNQHDCEEFAEYVPSLAPKELWNMRNAQRLLDQEINRETIEKKALADQRKLDIEWREQLAMEQREWQTKEREARDKRDNDERVWRQEQSSHLSRNFLLVGVGIFISAIISLLTLSTQLGWIGDNTPELVPVIEATVVVTATPLPIEALPMLGQPNLPSP